MQIKQQIHQTQRLPFILDMHYSIQQWSTNNFKYAVLKLHYSSAVFAYPFKNSELESQELLN